MTSSCKPLIQAFGWTLLLALSLPALADPVKIPLGQQAGASQAGELPRRGMHKQQVEQRFGAPRARHAAVGDPPISSWEYEHYVVYFEGDTVLHSVKQHRPRAEASSDARASDG